MDTSALDAALAALESQISGVERHVDSLEKWLWLSSIAVIIGVALEVYFVVRAYTEERNAWAKGIVRPPDKPSALVLAGEIASVILVVLGIIGELGVGILSSNANTKLRTLNNSRVQLVREKANAATTQAGDAKTSAKQASDAAVSAVGSANAAKVEADEMTRDVASAKELLTGIQTFLTPRILTRGEVNSLEESLRPFADPHVPIEVYGHSVQSLLSIQIVNALLGAGFSGATLKESPGVSLTPILGLTTSPRYKSIADRIAIALGAKITLHFDAPLPPEITVVEHPDDTLPIRIFVGDIRSGPRPILPQPKKR